jgi:hypothetical protein
MQILDIMPSWAFLLVAAAAVFLPFEIGLHFGRRLDPETGADVRPQLSVVVGSILGLFALLLAFTFNAAAGFYGDRRDAVLHHANAIGTAYLRADLIDGPARDQLATLLRDYVDELALIAEPISRSTQQAELSAIQARLESLRAGMWEIAIAEAEARPTPISGLIVQSLNETFDLEAERVQYGMRTFLPLGLWLMLMFVGAVGLLSAGFQAGLRSQRRNGLSLAMVASYALVLMLIADLDDPARGLLRTSQAPILDLQADIRR